MTETGQSLASFGLCLAARKAVVDKQMGADPNLPDGAGMTPVHLAAQHGHLGACTVLLGASDKALGAPNTIGVKPTDYQDVVFWSKVTDALPGSRLK